MMQMKMVILEPGDFGEGRCYAVIDAGMLAEKCMKAPFNTEISWCFL